MTFGRLLPCKECNGGQLVYRFVGTENVFKMKCETEDPGFFLEAVHHVLL